MTIVIGIIGALGGFIMGQMILYFLLRHKSNEELLTDKSLKLKFGLLNWACAALGAYAFIQTYQHYFGVS